ncbi:retrovirus-related pol polyprotein from transposon TNT 1-94 [Tanacetum coccineum]|uniref:Retrovirus-related pol polyprotein from transposon TNT 1-94 n=1 Tax=Tanacetum coccineum TaxID=301880 RepID=A0ABQ5E7U1_9ASTR
MTPEKKNTFSSEKEAIFLLLTGIGDEIYSTVDACNTANEMWIAIERLQQGESLNVQDVKTNLFWEFGKFTSRDGESMESYYSRFYKLMNELTRNNLQVTTMQVNVQFLQQLQPEWSRFVTLVKQSEKIDTISYHRLFDILKQFQKEVNDIRAERIAKSANPLALLAAAQPYSDTYYQAPKPQRSNATSSSTRQSASTRHKGKEVAKPITPQSESVSEEDSDPEQAQRDKEMQKNLALLAKYFKKLYKPTNNNLRTSSNSMNKTEDTTPRQSGMQQTRKRALTARDKGTNAKNARSQSGVKDYAISQEKDDDIGSTLTATWQRFKEVSSEESILLSAIGTGVNHTTSVSRPQLKCYEVKDKVVPNNSQVKFKKKEVEDHHRISSISKKTKSITACNDSSKSKTLNVNTVCAECGKCVFNSNHDACVFRYLNDVNAKTKKPKVVPISASKPKRKANKSIATPHKKTVASDTNIHKSKSYPKELSDQGTVTIKLMFIYVEGLNHNLFSVGQFCDADLEVAFRKSTCFVRDLQGNDLLTSNRGSDLYTISLQETTSSTPICFMAKASPTQKWLWHRRLSHLNFDYITLLSKKDIVIGLPKLTYVKDQLCSSCEMSKAKRSTFKSKDCSKFQRKAEFLHMELVWV